jgi:ribonuclease HI
MRKTRNGDNRGASLDGDSGTAVTDDVRSATLFTDAGARSNPGPAAIAYRVLEDGITVLEARAELVGEMTNNQAEYKALIVGLEASAALGMKAVTAISDSQLMIRQLRGDYRVKSAEIRPLYTRVRLLESEFDGVEYEYRPRRDPELAACDQMVNAVLTAAGHPKRPPPAAAFRRTRRRRKS